MNYTAKMDNPNSLKLAGYNRFYFFIFYKSEAGLMYHTGYDSYDPYLFGFFSTVHGILKYDFQVLFAVKRS